MNGWIGSWPSRNTLTLKASSLAWAAAPVAPEIVPFMETSKESELGFRILSECSVRVVSSMTF
jgi:hypothetical protein